MFSIKKGKSLNSTYNSNEPFPHVVIDNFLPKNLVRKAYKSLKQTEEWGYDELEWIQPFQQHKWQLDDEGDFPVPYRTKDVIKFLNSPLTLNFLTALTGIPNLIPDEETSGGGVHKITKGGKLNIHTDYGKHPTYSDLYRRINLLLYINPNWDESWGGGLHLKKEPVGESQIVITPLFNRAVIFNTTDISYHGHPDPLNCPENEARYSLAMYYFTKEKPDHNVKEFVNFF